jgi:hypothetical protein
MNYIEIYCHSTQKLLQLYAKTCRLSALRQPCSFSTTYTCKNILRLIYCCAKKVLEGYDQMQPQEVPEISTS